MNALTTLVFILHIGSGTIALFAGASALASQKGGTFHRRAGAVFVGSMLIMAVAADYLAIVMPDQLPNLLVGTFTFYLVTTAWLTVSRGEGEYGLPEKAAFAVILLLFAPFAILSFQLATGTTPFLKSAVPLRGPVMIAIYVFTLVTGIAVVTDLKIFLAGGITGKSRIERHLWRMCLGLAMAAGSAFTNGFPRLLPKGVHVPLIWLFMPQFIVLGVLVFWLIRVRFTRWYDGGSELKTDAEPMIAAAAFSPAATD